MKADSDVHPMRCDRGVSIDDEVVEEMNPGRPRVVHVGTGKEGSVAPRAPTSSPLCGGS
jgi:hypothetical protein